MSSLYKRPKNTGLTFAYYMVSAQLPQYGANVIG